MNQLSSKISSNTGITQGLKFIEIDVLMHKRGKKGFWVFKSSVEKWNFSSCALLCKLLLCAVFKGAEMLTFFFVPELNAKYNCKWLLSLNILNLCYYINWPFQKKGGTKTPGHLLAFLIVRGIWLKSIINDNKPEDRYWQLWEFVDSYLIWQRSFSP